MTRRGIEGAGGEGEARHTVGRWRRRFPPLVSTIGGKGNERGFERGGKGPKSNQSEKSRKQFENRTKKGTWNEQDQGQISLGVLSGYRSEGTCGPETSGPANPMRIFANPTIGGPSASRRNTRNMRHDDRKRRKKMKPLRRPTAPRAWWISVRETWSDAMHRMARQRSSSTCVVPPCEWKSEDPCGGSESRWKRTLPFRKGKIPSRMSQS